MSLKALFAASVLLVPALALATPLQQIDDNEDGTISRQEFDQHNFFQMMDTDRDGYVSRVEAGSGWVRMMIADRDKDGSLDSSEFHDGAWSAADRNGDDTVDADEWKAVTDEGWLGA